MTEGTEKVRARVLISGRVQGVCFRMFTEEQATERGLTGWVRNLANGQVEALFEGDKPSVDDMIAWCHRGPTAARVGSVEIFWEDYRGDFPDFRTVASASGKS